MAPYRRRQLHDLPHKRPTFAVTLFPVGLTYILLDFDASFFWFSLGARPPSDAAIPSSAYLIPV